MRRVSVAALAVSSVALLVGVVATPAAFAAPNATCTGTLAAGTYQNVTVPAGATCSIDSSNVILGNVTVGRDASFFDSGAPIRGNLQADHAASIEVFGGSIGGDMTATATSGENILCTTVRGNVVVQGSGPESLWTIGGCVSSGSLMVGGNLTVQNNAGFAGVQNNTVRGNISVNNNVGDALHGGGFLRNNTAGGNCQLFNNSPTYSGGNNNVPAGHQNTCNRNA